MFGEMCEYANVVAQNRRIAGVPAFLAVDSKCTKFVWKLNGDDPAAVFKFLPLSPPGK